MKRLKTLKPRVAVLKTTTVKPLHVANKRITGLRLQKRRLDIWKEHPHCVNCGRLVDYPDGFEVDHIVPLYKGGADDEDNCQVLCIECHKLKTKSELTG